ncbi:DUF397 domain-containing protein, partial [Streptomyces avermitilis]|uniref:DUF397 domain-containing protein n=1 Tax=Streptomyces avermitilis TaxID=33903 RepID=UPI00381851B4
TTGWQKSSFSGPGDGNECVELAYGDSAVLLRESDAPARQIAVTRDGLAALLRRIQAERP